MSYMGPRYVGGGRIFPQTQQNTRQSPNQPYQSQHFRNMQQQLQMVQMHLMQNQNQSPKGTQNQNATKNSSSDDTSKAKSGSNSTSGSGPTPNDQQNKNAKAPNKNQPESKPHNQTQHDKNQNNPTKTQSNAPPPVGPKQENKVMKQENFEESKGPMKSRFGNNPQQDPPPPLVQQLANQQQGSLMGQPPAALMSSPNKPDIRNDAFHSPNKNQSNFNSPNQYNSFASDHGKQNQQTRGGGKFSKGPQGGGGPNQRNVPPQQQQPPHEQDRSGRNLNVRPYDNRSRTPNARPDRQGGRAGGQSQQHPGPRGGKGYYYSGDKLKEKLLQLFPEPQLDLPAMEMGEKKFNNHAKLFIGNIPKNCEQKEIVSLFEQFGEIGSVYLNKDSAFAFINFDFKANASKALRELDNTLVKNRHLKVRFATISEGVRVKNLSPYVSNEMLEKAFSIFGMVESCRVSVDERGVSKGEGVIIFRDKKAAVMAIKKCQEECFFLSGAIRPVVVSTLDPPEDLSEGLPETSLPRNEDFRTERQIVPHFAESNSFEFDFGLQWKQLYSMYEEKKSVLDRDFQIEIERLEKKMVLAKVEYETDKLRKELAQREAESAELRRHFEYDGGNNYPSPPVGASSGAGGASYDPYPGSKRPIDQTYDGAFNAPYDPAYSDGYDRASAYPPSDYDRNYDQGYPAYGRDDYRREGGYGPEDPYDRPPYDHATDIPQERPPIFDSSADQGYAKQPPEAPLAGEPFKAPSKRPRY